MFKKLFTVSIILALCSTFMLAQNRAVLRSTGDMIKLKSGDMKEAVRVSGMKDFAGRIAKPVFHGVDGITAAGTIDTISYTEVGGTWNTNFGFFGQDVFMQYFEAPTEMTIKAAGFACSDETGSLAGFNVSVRLVRLNWTMDQLRAYSGTNFYAGYYPSDGDGFNEVDFFGEEATGSWVDKTSGGTIPLPPWADNVDPAANTFDYDLWSDGGFGWPITPELQDGAGIYQFVEMDNLGFEPEVAAGEVFAVVVIHNGTNLDGDRIGFYADATIGYPGWKYYENGRAVTGPREVGDPGWAVRAYTWDFSLIVDLTGDVPPTISNVTQLLTTIDQGPQTVEATITDINPSGGPAGVASADLMYSIDGGAFTAVAMTADGDVYSADIPGQGPGTVIDYYVEATDVQGNSSTSLTYQYQIFLPVHTNLVIYNGGSEWLDGYYQKEVFAQPYDLWYYGPVAAEMLDHYDNIIEISSIENGPSDDNQDAFTTWLAAGNRQFMVIGQEILGYLYGYANQTFAPGDYEYDALGVLHSYNDVNYAASGDQALPSLLLPQAGGLAQATIDTMAAAGTDSLLYWPDDVVGADNWMDQFDPVAGLQDHEVFMHGVDVGGTELPVGHRFIDANNNKIVFMSFDPLMTEGNDGSWYGGWSYDVYSEALRWFGLDVVGVDDDGQVPTIFAISQNYPNPFNPSTKITYSVPSKSNITLKVFNVLGQEVATLVDAVKNVGTHEVTFNATNLSSGVYFYTLTANDFVSTKKMMLIK